MHLISCSHCQAEVAVSPSKAGQQVDCPKCGGSILLPKLGELRKLPTADSGQQNDGKASAAGSGTNNVTSDEGQIGYSIVFAVLALIATACLVIAAFCTIRWALLKPSSSTEEHIAGLKEAYGELSAAELIREYEDMEKSGVEIESPYQYQAVQNQKDEWGFNAIVAASIGVIAVVGAGTAAAKR